MSASEQRIIIAVPAPYRVTALARENREMLTFTPTEILRAGRRQNGFVQGGASTRGNRLAIQQRRLPSHARSEEHTSELQPLMRISYAVFCLKKKKANKQTK